MPHVWGEVRMKKRDTKAHSRWECRSCEWGYEAPLAGQAVLGHRAVDGGRKVFHKVKRVWRSKYDRM